jgi:amino acid adenylation domain-containing protein
MALLAAYKTLLMRLSGQTDVIVGTPLLGRDRPELEAVVGMFANTLPLRTDLSGELDFASLLARVRDTVVGAQDHSDVPFERIVAAAKTPRDLGRSPLFQTMFGFGGLPSAKAADPAINALPVDTGAAKWDLTLFLDHDGEGIGGQLEYAADLFDEATARRYASAYERLCARLAEASDRPITRLPLLDDGDRTRIVEDLNPYAVPPDRHVTMAQPFEAQARRAPDRVAIETLDGRRLTYGELDAAANRLAQWLIDQGVGPGRRVGICMQRSPELVLAIYAVAKTGGAYVPLDPDLPDGRIAFMIEDIAPSLVLVHEPTRPRLAAADVRVADLDQAEPPWAAFPAVAPSCPGPAGLPVHYLYTSGTTGRPKAVVYPISAALAEIFWLHGRYPSLGPGDTNLFLTSYGFDVSIWEIFWTLYFGARLIVPGPGDHRDPRRIAALVRQYEATTLFLIPGLLEAVLEEPDFAAAGALRWVFCGGAPVGARLRDRFYEQRPSTILINCYGPTEAGAVTDMALPRDPGNPVVPLGRPAANFRLYVLDDNLEPCLIGVPGEVYLAGKVGVAIGYHRRPAMTAEKFLPDPFGEPGGRMYRTGDLCRYRPDGVLEHLGRADRQVKVRGMRIEPGEIEAVLCEHPAVARCHLLVLEAQGRQGQLPAFVTLQPGQSATATDLRAHAARLLPRHMVPTAIVVVDAIPTNVNNKVDQAALAALAGMAADAVDDEVAFAPPETAEQAALLEIFREVVGHDQAGIDHDFFAVGGHSLLIFRLIARCEDRLGWRPEVVEVFAAPTVRALACLMTERREDAATCLAPLAPAAGKPLLVLVHPAGGSVLPFMSLAQQLRGDFSVWGLQSPDSLATEWSIGALAALYASAVDARRGLSPVILAGWSMGGCVALEMARLWRSSPAAPAAVLLLDTWTPPMTLAERGRARLTSTLQGLDVLRRETPGVADLEIDAAILGRMAETCRRNIDAFAAYQPAPLDLEIDYLRARDTVADPDDIADALGVEPDRGWGRFVRGVAVEIVDGDHFSMVDAPHCASLAAAIRAIAGRRLAGEEI